jgi:DNA polymerase-3 subunit alpha
MDKCLEYVEEYKSIFPNFYLEMQSHKSEYQVEYNRKILELSNLTNTPYVITCDAHASSEQELKYQGYHVKIAKDIDTASEIYEGCYLQSVDEIYETMIPQIGEYAVTVGLQTTLDILNIVDDVKMPFREPQMPKIDFGNVTPDEKLRELVVEGFKTRKIADRHRGDELQDYLDRIEYEMSVIEQMGFASYFLIVWDFVNYARSMKMPTSDGRGSSAGSMILYLLGITNIDPIKYGLVFERFLNKERISLPD